MSALCQVRLVIDVVFMLRKIKETFLAKQKKLYICFIYLKKAFSRVEKKVVEFQKHWNNSDEPVQRCKAKSEDWNTFV